jgi:Zn finger protein HypA/HybF involved in hydrogenase expression
MRPVETACGRCNKCGLEGELATEDDSFGHEFGIHHESYWVCEGCGSSDVEITYYDVDVPDKEDR